MEGCICQLFQDRALHNKRIFERFTSLFRMPVLRYGWHPDWLFKCAHIAYVRNLDFARFNVLYSTIYWSYSPFSAFQ